MSDTVTKVFNQFIASAWLIWRWCPKTTRTRSMSMLDQFLIQKCH